MSRACEVYNGFDGDVEKRYCHQADRRALDITEEHSELAGLRLDVLEAVADPVRIVQRGYGSLLATREIEPGRFLVVVYRELEGDGFIITAFLTSRVSYLDRRKQLWP